MKLFTRNSAILTLALAALGATAAHATVVAVAAIPTGISGQITENVAVTGWTNAVGTVSPLTSAYNFIYANQSVALSPGAPGGDGNVAMDALTVGDGSATTPFFALDGDFDTGAISTTLTGLISGATVTINFDWAATQQLFSLSGSNGGCPQCTGASSDQMQVTLGTQIDLTGTKNVASQGFNPWSATSLTFVVTGGPTETLSFMDLGQPLSNQVPAFALLDNISASQVAPPPTPEPSSLLLLGTGLAGLSGLVRSRFKKSSSAKV